MHDTHMRGFTLIEVVVASAICLTIVVGIVGAFVGTLRVSANSTARVQAAFLEEEGLEALRILRDNGWTSNIASLTSGTTYYLTYDSAALTWKATTTRASIDSTFYRTFVLSDVYRDGSKNIVSSGGTLDSAIKKCTVSVAWQDRNATTTRSLSTYLTNIFSN